MKGLIFTFGMTYGGAVIALFRPFIGLLIYVCFAIIKPDALWFWSVPEGNYSRIIALAVIVGWAINGFGSFRLGRGRLMLFAIMGYLTWSALSAFGAIDQEAAWVEVEKYGKIVLPILVGATLINSIKQINQLAWVMVLSQGYLAFEFNMSYWSGYNRLLVSGFAGMEEKSVAMSILVSAPTAFFLGLNAKNYLAKLLAFGCAALIIHLPMFCNSRSGLFALMVSGLVIFILIRKNWTNCLAFLFIIAIAVRLVGPQVSEKFMTSFAESDQLDNSAKSRLTYWGQCWDTMLQYPITGIGPRNWTTWTKNYGATGAALEAHSTWFQTGAELGFPGLIFLGLFYTGCIAMLWPLARDRSGAFEPEIQNLAIMVISGLLAFIVSAQFITAYELESPYFLTLIGIGLIKVISKSEMGEMGQPEVFAYGSLLGTGQYDPNEEENNLS